MFRRRRTKKMLSADELKTKLYSHLDKTGSLNRMRIELREKLISELFKKAPPAETADVSGTVYTFDRTVLPLQISNWLVYDHLLRQGYQYALSNFVTEANFPVHPEKLLAACDILILLGLDSTSLEYKNISQMCSTSNTQFAHSLLVAVIKCLFDLTTREGGLSETKEQSATQEESGPEIIVHGRNLDSEPSEFKESDKFLKLRKEPTDLSLHDQVLFIKEEKEKEVQQLRHKLLQELDRLHAQEHKHQLEIQQLRNELQREKDDLFSENEKLRKKEFLMDKEYENKLEKKIRELETDFIAKMQSKEKELKISQQKLHDKEQKLNLLEMNISNQKESYMSLKKELEDMKQLHTVLQTKYSNLLDENTSLLKKFESMSDYAVLKDDLETKSKELKNLQQEFEEYCKQAEKGKESLRENLQKLDTKLQIKETELLEIHRQLNLARDTLHIEEAVWHKERRKLEQEVISSREMYQTLIQRIEEQKEDIQALHRTIHILHYQLSDKSTRNTARVEPIISNKSSFKVLDVSRKEPEFFRMNRGTDNSPSKYRQKSLKFIEEAKDRINKLQQEADVLQYKSSIVYSSAPKVPPNATSNPLQLNLTEQRLQPSTTHAIKPFVSQMPFSSFENLIRNELPTLDLSFPTHIKNHSAYTYANDYKSESIVRAHATAADRRLSDDLNMSLKDSQNVSKNSNASFTLHPDISSSKDNNQKINNELFKVDRASEGTKQYDFDKSNNSQILPVESILKKPLSNNTNISVAVPSYVQGNENSVTKNSGKLSGVDIQNLPKVSSQEIPVQTHDVSLIRSLNESKPETPVEMVKENKVPESDVEKSISGFQQVSETPLLIDLDAAWKRKSSLKSSIPTSPFRKLPPKVTSKEITPAMSSQLPDVEQDLFVSSSSKRDLSENFNVDLSHIVGQQSIELQRNQESHSGDSERSENSKEIKIHRRIEPQNNNESNSEVNKLQKIELQGPFPEKAGTVSVDISKSSDSDGEQKKALNDQKPVHDDSISELSEIHLSCGSEQEQQKEDSDNW